MPYHLKKVKNKWYVFDNSNKQSFLKKDSKKRDQKGYIPFSHGFPTKKQARKQEIAVILSQSRKLNLPTSYFFS